MVLYLTVGGIEPILVNFGARRAGDPAALLADISRAVANLGWTIRRAGIDPIIETAWAWRGRNPAIIFSENRFHAPFATGGAAPGSEERRVDRPRLTAAAPC